MNGPTRGIQLVLVAVASLIGVVADVARASGQGSGEAAPISGLRIPPGYRRCRYLRLIDPTPRVWCDAFDMNTTPIQEVQRRAISSTAVTRSGDGR
jgi:hypothetical protein